MPLEQGSASDDARTRGDLIVLEIADDPEAWRNAGFLVTGESMVLDGVEFRFVGEDAGGDTGEGSETTRGIRGWHLQHISTPGADLDGLVDVAGPAVVTGNVVDHPNGIDVIDHLVVATPDLERTIAAFTAAGLEARRTRTVQVGDTERQQTFFWAGSTILEMIGIVGESGEGPATLWGLALVSGDLDATAKHLGELLSTPKDAVQPGRRIATLRTRELRISVPVAVMTPHTQRPVTR